MRRERSRLDLRDGRSDSNHPKRHRQGLFFPNDVAHYDGTKCADEYRLPNGCNICTMVNMTNMNPKQYKRAIEDVLGMNQIQAAEFFDCALRTTRYYAAHGAPTVVSMLLAVMIEKDISVEEVNRIVGRKPKRDIRKELIG
jgi:hypothetical protein